MLRTAARKALSLLETCAINTGLCFLNVVAGLACCMWHRAYLAAGVESCGLESARVALLLFTTGDVNLWCWSAEQHVVTGTIWNPVGTGRSFSAAACSHHKRLRGHSKPLATLTYAYPFQLLPTPCNIANMGLV